LYKRLTDDEAVPCPSCGSPILTEKFCASCGAANPIDYIDESVRVSKAKVVQQREERRARVSRQVPKKPIMIGAVAAIAILLAAFIGMSYALGSMQFRIREVSGFDFASLSSTVELEACNPTAFPASFDKFSAEVSYRNGQFASMVVDGGYVMPYQSPEFHGKLRLNTQTVSGLIIALADAVGGRDTVYNENDISLKMTVDAKVLGIIPYSQTREFAFAEFQEFMSTQKAETYSCK
jgi:ribosomal protein L32